MLLILGLFTGAQIRGLRAPLSLEVLQTSDPAGIGMVTRMTLKAANHGTAEISPIFTVLASFPFPVRWRGVSGPPRLAPKSDGVYQIDPPPAAAIPVGDDFVVRVNDARGHVFVVSPPTRARLEHRLAIVNPGFTQWVTDPATDQPSPLGWEVVGLRSPIGPNLSVMGGVVAGRQALLFHGMARTLAGQGIRVQQSITDPDGVTELLDRGFNVSVYPTFRYSRGDEPKAGATGNIFGIQVYANGQLLWISFSDTGAGWYVRRSAVVVVIDSPLMRWSSHHIDLGAMYHRLGWARPSEIALSLLADAAALSPQPPDPAFGAISLGSAQPP